jgi:hypothetical protein
MKRFRGFVVILTLAAVFTAPAAGDYWHGDFTEESTVVFQDGSPVYAYPDITSDIVSTLSRGEPVDVQGSGGVAVLGDGTRTYWYRVSMQNEADTIEGWMPGTSLAMVSLQPEPGSLFMFTITGYDSSAFSFTGSAVLMKEGEPHRELTINPVGGESPEAPYDYSVRATLLDPSGLDRVEHLVELSFIYEACGYPNIDMLIAVTENGMVAGPSAGSQFEAGLYTFAEDFILPRDSSGVPNEVLITGWLGLWDEDGDEYLEQERTVRTVQWTENEFIEQAD